MSSTHTIYFTVEVTMHDMDGHPEQSAEIAADQLYCALQGKESQYGLPGDWHLYQREWYDSSDVEDDSSDVEDDAA